MDVPEILQKANWLWTHSGLEVALVTDKGMCKILLPIGHVEMIFRNSLASVGCPMGQTLGAPGSTHGFLTTVGAAHSMYVGGKRGKRGKKRKSIFKGKFFRGLGKAVKAVGTVAKKVVTNPVFRAGFAALSTAFPVLAPAAAGLEVAARVIKKIDKGKEALKKLTHKKRVGAPGDAQLEQDVKEAVEAMKGLQSMKRLAQAGDQRAQQALGNIIGAQAVMAG